MEKASGSRRLLAAAVAVASVSLLALAFLLGRASGPGNPAVRPTGRERPGADIPPPYPEPRAPQQSLPPSSPAAASTTEPADTHPVPASIPAAAAREPGSAGTASDRAAVAAYFDALDHVQPGKMSGDAEGTARETDCTGKSRTGLIRRRCARPLPPPDGAGVRVPTAVIDGRDGV